jgi:hypothetical protein
MSYNSSELRASYEPRVICPALELAFCLDRTKNSIKIKKLRIVNENNKKIVISLLA